jgi:hypothetical protein
MALFLLVAVPSELLGKEEEQEEQEECVLRRLGHIKPVIKVAAVGAAIVVEQWLYRKMRLAGWRVRP